MNFNAYDFKLIKSCIDGFQQLIDTASIGMLEDWFWTAETVFEDGAYRCDILAEGYKPAGIEGSPWASPILLLRYKDGTEAIFDCGTFTREQWDRMEKRQPTLGCKSGPLSQLAREQLFDLPRFQLLNTQPQLEQLTDDQATT